MASDYWTDCIAEAFEDAGLVVTKEQLNIVASWVAGAHDNYSMSHGYDCISNPMREEIKSLEDKLYKERNKIICRECNGSGSITTYGPVHSATSGCYKCRGEGRV